MKAVYHSELVCPKCEARNSIVKDSRGVQDASHIRRRRSCEECGHRFTTMEVIAEEDADGNLKPAVHTDADEALARIRADFAEVFRRHGVQL